MPILTIKNLKELNTKIKDWMGNEIKEGHTVCIYATKPTFSEISLVDFRTQKVLHSAKAPDCPIWKLRDEFIVEPGLFRTYKNEYGSMMVKIHPAWIKGREDDVVCIKGISDNKKLYFKTHGINKKKKKV